MDSPIAPARDLDLSRPLEGKTTIVTGAAVGLGRAVAILFAAAGAAVIVTDVDSQKLEDVVAELEDLDAPVLAITCDVTNGSSVTSAVERAIARFGQVDVVVNNAGVHLRNDTSALTLDDADWERAFAVHTKGPYLMTRAVMPYMQERRRGSIVNVSSIGALYGSGGGHAYRASKAALLSLTRTLAIELAPYGVRVNAILPGAMDTPLRQFASLERKVIQPETIPLGRVADPVEVAHCILFLASDSASFVTGALLIADGGQMAA